MDIILSIPDDIAQRLGGGGHDLPRRLLEAFSLEEYRASRLTRSELLRMLDYASWDEVDSLLRTRHVTEAMSHAEFERAVLGVASGSIAME